MRSGWDVAYGEREREMVIRAAVHKNRQVVVTESCGVHMSRVFGSCSPSPIHMLSSPSGGNVHPCMSLGLERPFRGQIRAIRGRVRFITCYNQGWEFKRASVKPQCRIFYLEPAGSWVFMAMKASPQSRGVFSAKEGWALWPVLRWNGRERAIDPERLSDLNWDPSLTVSMG